MNKQNDGGPAFPEVAVTGLDNATLLGTAYSGMSLRDYFAGQALTGGIGHGWDQPPELAARNCYDIADAMLA